MCDATKELKNVGNNTRRSTKLADNKKSLNKHNRDDMVGDELMKMIMMLIVSD